MELKYSTTGVPYLELDEVNKLIFSKTTATRKGYKWLVFSGMSTATETLSSGKGKKKTKRKIVITAPVSTIINMGFSGLTKNTKNANVFLTKRYMDGLRRLFEPYLDEGIFPYDKIPKFAADLSTECINTDEDLLDEDPSGYYEDDPDEIDD